MKRFLTATLLVALLCLLPVCLRAQRYSVSTNLAEWANLGTINGEAGVAVGRHISLHAGTRFNNWTFRKGNPEDRFENPLGDDEKQFENRKVAFAFDLRYWPWYVYSSWWGYVRGQYMEYNRGGLLRHSAEEGDAYGIGLGAGYTYLLHRNWNIEFGAGIWGGTTKYTAYRCTNCGSVTSSGNKFFLLPDDVFISLNYIF